MKRALSRLTDYAYERFGGGFMIAMGALGSVIKLIVGFMLAMHLIASVFYIIGGIDMSKNSHFLLKNSHFLLKNHNFYI